jgi:hypothetical protein
MLKEMVVAESRYYTRTSLKGLKETTKKLIHDG